MIDLRKVYNYLNCEHEFVAYMLRWRNVVILSFHAVAGISSEPELSQPPSSILHASRGRKLDHDCQLTKIPCNTPYMHQLI